MSSDEKPASIWINYLYFGSLFALTILLSATTLFSHENLGGSRIFYLFYSIGESLFEVTLLMIAGQLICRFLPRKFFVCYIGLTFLCFLWHLLDFILDRITNFSTLETLEFVFDESFENFFHLLDASGLPLWTWMVLFALLASVPLIGILIYRMTEWLAKTKPFGLRFDFLMQAFFCIPVALLLWDFSASRLLHHESHHRFVHSLPWKITFLPPHTPMLTLPNSLPLPPSEQRKKEILAELTPVCTTRPNIYFFVVESLRKDVLVPEIAPTLSEFRNQHLECKESLSNANGSHLSWFSLFHSNFPYYWNTVQQQGGDKEGSPALQLLRKMGYQIRVYSSANLSYYKMDDLLFGEKGHLADSFHRFPHKPPKQAYQSDIETIDAFAQDIKRPDLQQGQCFIFFWDATHFDYSWPKEPSPPRFSPVARAINYFQACQSQENLTLIKNRYKNAVHFIDNLFHRFLSLVPHFADALIVFSGDHGEAFFEDGHLFHLSQLTNVQTQVPIILKLPRQPSSLPPLMTHMDIFPTLIDALTADGTTAPLLEGQSLFLPSRWPYAVIARYNASRTPREFCLHNGSHKVIARFENDAFQSRFLRILSVQTCQDQLFHECNPHLEGWIRSEFGPALTRLFPDEN